MHKKNYNTGYWTVDQLAYLYKCENPHITKEEAYANAKIIKQELLRMNTSLHRNTEKFFSHNIPFSEYYAHDKYSNYFDEENEF